MQQNELAYCGHWQLVSELSFYEEGQAPESGLYHIKIQNNEVQLSVSWVPVGSDEVSIQFGGPMDGQLHTQEKPAGAMVSYSAISPLILDTAMFVSGRQVLYVRRRVSRDGQLMSVLQSGHRNDATQYRNTQVYRRIS